MKRNWIADFMRTRKIGQKVVFEVATVRWIGAHTPKLRWTKLHSWTSPTDSEIAAAQNAALNDPRFFAVCSTCNQRCNVGHMHLENICMSCAERTFGVQY